MKSARLLLCLLVGFLAIWQCSAVPDLYLFNGGITGGFSLETDQPSRIVCEAVYGKGINGGKAMTAYTTSYAQYYDNCYIKANSGRLNINNFTEIEFFIKAAPKYANKGHVGMYIKDADDVQKGNEADVPTTYTRFRFPIRNTFNGVNFNKILSPFFLELFLVKGDTIYADKVVLRDRDYFDIFSDSTSQGREAIYSWGGYKDCYIKPVSGAPDGDEVLAVPSDTWGCGLFFDTPTLDLSYFSKIQFQLKSKCDVKIEIETTSDKKSVNVPDTNNKWKLITLNLSQFGLNLKNTRGPFLITKIGDASQEVQVDKIRYLP